MELRECPFCGGEARCKDNGYEAPVIDENGAYVDMDINEASDFWVECLVCHGCGPMCNTDEAAEAAWNRRHVPALPEPFTPTPIDPVAQHYPCNDCPFDREACGIEGCERLKRYEAAREATP